MEHLSKFSVHLIIIITINVSLDRSETPLSIQKPKVPKKTKDKKRPADAKILSRICKPLEIHSYLTSANSTPS